MVDILPEIPLWVKHPDYERVSITFQTFLLVVIFMFSKTLQHGFFMILQIDWFNDVVRDMWPYIDKVNTLKNLLLVVYL